ncbi:hypothetical protein SAMN05518671_2713 [Stenotrophomonas lactitubi]|nr:hypothetical protein SAMN05518671_2713 [Stenotrophomonas lactitubi]
MSENESDEIRLSDAALPPHATVAAFSIGATTPR